MRSVSVISPIFPSDAFTYVSTDGVALPKTSFAPLYSALICAISIVEYLGEDSLT